ncbi:hypothetical protein [Hymenobacter jeollabukensis]|uniref:YD repeat-containing protein n=1 Tax=Hymenobacter jeollabukensis TaxID=2025313 RepID=A0A5R8WXG2_9BACT|nr:hypothetical protein [Hymenobacter jeollabukensis]TLM97059.1 hypothetical protein FDY95_03450 [Hymenobacter jeollabukensis]
MRTTDALSLVAGLALLSTTSVRAQSLNVEQERFPGAKRLKIQAFGRGPAGFWALYQFDNQGHATEEKRYRSRRHLSTTIYTYNRRHQVLRQATTFDINHPNTTHNIYNTYRYNADSSRVLLEVCYTDTDTLYIARFLEFDAANRPTKLTQAHGLGRAPASLTEITYATGQETNRRTDYEPEGATITTVTHQYNDRGHLIQETRSMSPKPAVTFWIDGQGDNQQYDYDYSPRGPWTKQYELIEGKKVLVEKRTFRY